MFEDWQGGPCLNSAFVQLEKASQAKAWARCAAWQAERELDFSSYHPLPCILVQETTCPAICGGPEASQGGHCGWILVSKGGDEETSRRAGRARGSWFPEQWG